MKIYTKTGDQGQTGLLGGIRVSKSDLAIDVCGELDETSSFIGTARCGLDSEEFDCVLSQIQNDLFDLGSRVAGSSSSSARRAEFPETRVEQLESWIDQFQDRLPELKEFILPSGGRAGAQLHLARSVCRRCERRLVLLMESGQGADLRLESIYLNRLGDLLFVLARCANQQSGFAETTWQVTC